MFSRSCQPRNGVSRHGSIRASLVRFSSRKRRKPGASPGAIAAICCSMRGDVGRRLNLAALAEDDAILRIEPHHFHLLAKRRAGGGEDFFEHARVEEKRRTEIEPEAVRFDRRSPPADRREPLDDFHFHSRRGEKNGRGQAAGTGADDDDVLFHVVEAARGKERSEFCFHAAGAEGAPAARGLERQECGRQSEANTERGGSRPQNDCGGTDHDSSASAEKPPLFSILDAKRFDFSLFISLISVEAWLDSQAAEGTRRLAANGAVWIESGECGGRVRRPASHWFRQLEPSSSLWPRCP